MRTIAWLKGIGRLSRADLVALAHAADRIPTTPTNLATVEGFESEFDPAVPNHAGSGARGVIQFMPKTMCALLGMTPDMPDPVRYSPGKRKAADARFVAMTFIEQQEYVVKYFAWFKGKNLEALEDLYLAIFWPAAIGKPDSYVIGRRGSDVYRQNAGFDRSGNRDGEITRDEVVAAIRRFRATANGNPEIEIPESPPVNEVFSDEERRHYLELVARTSEDATEDFRRGTPLPEDVHLVTDDEAPPTPRNDA